MRSALASAALLACTPTPPPTPPTPTPAPPPAPAPEPPPVAAREPPCDPNEPLSAPDVPDVGDDLDDPDGERRRERARRELERPLAARLTAALPTHRPACDVSVHGPCAARGDLDGDGQPDDVVHRDQDGWVRLHLGF